MTMLSKDWHEKLKLLSFIVKCIFREFSDLAILYLLCSYYRIKKRQEGFTVKILHPKLFHQILQKHDRSKLFDIHNTIIINDAMLFEDEIFVKLVVNENSTSSEKIVLAAGLPSCPSSHIFVSNILVHNIDKNITLTNVTIKPIRTSKLEFATGVDISFFPHPSIDLHFLAVHAILKNFFTVPKLVYKDEIMQINLKTYAKDVYYAMSDTDRMNDFNQSLHIKCNSIIKNGNSVSGGCLCVHKETSVTQAADSAGFLPATSGCCLSLDEEVDYNLRAISPLGLRHYFKEFQKAVEPFLMKRKIPLNPVFLIEGSRGDGKEQLLQELALYLGINHYRINSIDLTANVYAQNETKLRNVFFNAKTSAPCLLSLHYFENFGKNNEGEYDERLIGHFKSELELLLQNNTFPVIIFCCSNTKGIPAELRRLFLQIFHFEAPCEEERESIIKWYLDSNNLEYSLNIEDLASETNGFLYEDLTALIQNAIVRKMKKAKLCKEEIILGEEDIMKSLERLHSSYNESIGAPKVPKVQWSDIGGLGDIKEEINKTINLPLKYPDLLKVTGLKRSGILLFGPPGTGKTLLAKAIATECGLCFLSIKGPELLNKYVGQSEQNVREVFQKARQASPCIIFFDELDSLAPNRGRSGDSGGVMDRVVSQLLAEMDGLNEEKVVFVIGATNRPDLIDPALLRPGRFDKLLYVGPCTDDQSKVSVLKAITQKFNLHDDVDFNKLIQISPKNITGADYYGVCSNAWSAAVRRLIKAIEIDNLDPHSFSQKDVVVSMEDFEYAFKNTKPSISEVDLLYYEKLKEELSSKK